MGQRKGRCRGRGRSGDHAHPPPAPHYIEGRAYLFDRTNPLRNASLDLVGYSRPRPEPIVRTDGDGRFVVGPFHGGDYFVHLGYQDCRLVLIPIVLDAKSPQKVEVVFQKGVTVSGRVTDPLGRGVPAVDVSWQREHTSENARLRTTTDENGAYELRGLEPARYLVRVEGLGCGTRPPIEVTLSGAALEHVPLLAECMPGFEVAVENADGEPVPGVWVHLHYRIQSPRCRAGGRRSLFTDESGRASLVCVPPETWIELQVADPRFVIRTRRSMRPVRKGRSSCVSREFRCSKGVSSTPMGVPSPVRGSHVAPSRSISGTRNRTETNPLLRPVTYGQPLYLTQVT